MPISLICASHTPLLHRVPIDGATTEAFRASIGKLAEHVRAFEPDYVIQFSPDHYQGFFHRLMPSFCIGTAARSAADWDIPAGEVNVPSTVAHDLITWLRDRQFDIVRSRDMVVDHGFLQIWQEMFGAFTVYPTIPIFINCIAPPLPSYKRIRKLGEEIGRFALRSEARVLIAASGGLSHDPPMPNVDSAPPDTASRLIGGRPRTPDERERHERQATQAGLDAMDGRGPCRPLNPDWDRTFLETLQRGDLKAFDAYTDLGVIAEAGGAGNEVLTWVAAFSALSAAGPFDVSVEFYQPIPGWIAGTAAVTASPRA